MYDDDSLYRNKWGESGWVVKMGGRAETVMEGTGSRRRLFTILGAQWSASTELNIFRTGMVSGFTYAAVSIFSLPKLK